MTSGTVDLPEMKDALALFGHEEEITEFFNSIDTDKSGDDHLSFSLLLA